MDAPNEVKDRFVRLARRGSRVWRNGRQRTLAMAVIFLLLGCWEFIVVYRAQDEVGIVTHMVFIELFLGLAACLATFSMAAGWMEGGAQFVEATQTP